VIVAIIFLSHGVYSLLVFVAETRLISSGIKYFYFNPYDKDHCITYYVTYEHKNSISAHFVIQLNHGNVEINFLQSLATVIYTSDNSK